MLTLRSGGAVCDLLPEAGSYFQLQDAGHNYYIKGQTCLFGRRGTF